MAQASGLQSLKNDNIKFLEEEKEKFLKEIELYMTRVKSEIQADDHLGERVMAQAKTFFSQPMPDNSDLEDASEDLDTRLKSFKDDMQSEINKIRSELEQEQQERKKLQDKVSKINEQQEPHRLVTTRFSAVEDFQKSTSQAMTSKQKAPRSARLKTSFEARVSSDQHQPRITDILILPGGDILTADCNNKSLNYFNPQGCFLHKKTIESVKDINVLADLCGGRVALLNCDEKTLKIFSVTKSGIEEESKAQQVKKQYTSLVALDQQTLACSVKGQCKVDVLDLTGNCLRPIKTSERVNFMSLSEDGSLVCTYESTDTGILKIDPVSGSGTLKKSVPGVKELQGVATTKDNCIIVGDLEMGAIHLLSSTGDLVKTLWSVPEADGSGMLRCIAVSEDMLVCCTWSKIFVLELVS